MTEFPGDIARVRELLGREPRGDYDIVVRTDEGDPVVLRNAPFLDDGTPMPTRYWLIGPDEIRRVGRLESEGGVDRAEAEVDDAELAAAHARYAAERDAVIPDDHDGPRPSGGVGGTRTGVKCLHAHWAWHLAGGDDPIGRWIERELDPGGAVADGDGDTTGDDRPDIVVGPDTTMVAIPGGGTATIPWGAVNLAARWLADRDPPRPADLTNALGTVTDEIDDIIREHEAFGALDELRCGGPPMTSIARVEIGAESTPDEVALTKPDAEEIFRMLATESSRERAHNPGLASDDVDTVVASCCILLAFVRRLRLDEVTLLTTEC